MKEEKITIPLEEYKELLEIKGKYEESKITTIKEYVPIITTPYCPNTLPHQQTITWY